MESKGTITLWNWKMLLPNWSLLEKKPIWGKFSNANLISDVTTNRNFEWNFALQQLIQREKDFSLEGRLKLFFFFFLVFHTQRFVRLKPYYLFFLLIYWTRIFRNFSFDTVLKFFEHLLCVRPQKKRQLGSLPPWSTGSNEGEKETQNYKMLLADMQNPMGAQGRDPISNLLRPDFSS